MTTFLALFIGIAIGGLLAAAAARAEHAVAKRRRIPVQMFEGRLFPHPLDEEWKVDSFNGSAEHEPAIRLLRRSNYGGNWSELRVNGVLIAEGERVTTYLVAIEDAARRRAVERALEAIP